MQLSLIAILNRVKLEPFHDDTFTDLDEQLAIITKTPVICATQHGGLQLIFEPL
jgi:hypothetical protein